MKRKKIIVEITKEMLTKGKPGNCSKCPIALAILKGLKRVGHVNVQYDFIEVVAGGELFTANLSKKAAEFIVKFDDKKQRAKLKPTKIALTFDVQDISSNRLSVVHA